MMVEGEDGITHINVYSKAKTSIGKWLSNFAYSPVNIDGQSFMSLEGYWYYLCTGDISMKNYFGYKAKEEGRKREKIRKINEALFKKALDIKLKTYLDKAKELAETDLPLTHYYDYGGKRVEAGYSFIIEHLELRRQQLKEYFKSQ